MKQEKPIPAAVGILKTGGAKFPPLLIHALPPDEKIPRILQGGAGVDERLFVRLLAGWMYRTLFGCPLPGIAYTPDGAPYIFAPRDGVSLFSPGFAGEASAPHAAKTSMQGVTEGRFTPGTPEDPMPFGAPENSTEHAPSVQTENGISTSSAGKAENGTGGFSPIQALPPEQAEKEAEVLYPARVENGISASSVGEAENGTDPFSPLSPDNTADEAGDFPVSQNGTLPCPREPFSVSFSHTEGYVCVAFALPALSHAAGEAEKTDKDPPSTEEETRAVEDPERGIGSAPASAGGDCTDKAEPYSPGLPKEMEDGQKSTRLFAGAAVGVDIERADTLADPARQKKLAERFLRRVPLSPPDDLWPIAVMGCRWDPVARMPVPLAPTTSVGACLHTPSEYRKQLFTYYEKTRPSAGIEAEKRCQDTNRRHENISSGTEKTKSRGAFGANQKEEKTESPSDFTVRFTALEATLKAAGKGFGAYPQVEEWLRKTVRYTAWLTFPDAQLALTLALAPEGAQKGENEKCGEKTAHLTAL